MIFAGSLRFESVIAQTFGMLRAWYEREGSGSIHYATIVHLRAALSFADNSVRSNHAFSRSAAPSEKFE